MQLSLTEFAKCVGMPANTIERWIRQGHLPVKKRGDICIFNEQALDKWAAAHNLTFALPGTGKEVHATQDPVNLSTTMRRGGFYYDVSGSDVDEVLRAAVDRMEAVAREDKDILYGNLLEREQMMSTGIGKGVAIPHPRKPLSGSAIPPQIATCFLREKIPYNAVDNQPVFVLFVLVASTAKQHLHLLSRISFCLRDVEFLENLSRVPDPDTMLDVITEFDNRLDAPANNS